MSALSISSSAPSWMSTPFCSASRVMRAEQRHVWHRPAGRVLFAAPALLAVFAGQIVGRIGMCADNGLSVGVPFVVIHAVQDADERVLALAQARRPGRSRIPPW